MEVKFKAVGNILIAYVNGEVDHYGAAPLRDSIDSSLREFNCRNLLLDFSGVSFMDSSGIGVVLGRYKKLSKIGGRIVISGCTPYVRELLNMAGVFRLIRSAETYSDALSFMLGQEQMRMEV